MRPAPLPWGLAFATAIIAAWLVSLPLLLQLPLTGPGLAPGPLALLVVLGVVARSFLQTGLFIVAHDAMHGSLLPQARRWNDRIGRLALLLYAGLPWQRSRRHHQRHHRHPAGHADPDHHGGHRFGIVGWYARFLATYLRPIPLASLLGAWGLTLALAGPQSPHPLANLLLFWILPLLISSLQLFLVGTYLPHRPSDSRSTDSHRSASLDWPPLLSLLACFHFGYHWQHHHTPSLPWYRLPQQRRSVTVRPVHPR